jgi:glycosyltransferase involved in cell wall biosynthesis
VNLKIVGDGPLSSLARAAADSDSRIQWLHRLEPSAVMSILDQARCLIMPSVCYETFGLTIAEAFAKGTPTITANLGAMAELVDDGRTGLVFEANNAADLVSKVKRLWAEPAAAFRQQARSEYESNYTAAANYEKLIEIYQRAVSSQPAPDFYAVD